MELAGHPQALCSVILQLTASSAGTRATVTSVGVTAPVALRLSHSGLGTQRDPPRYLKGPGELRFESGADDHISFLTHLQALASTR